MIGPVLAAEDAHFYDHKGINIRSILRAVDANLESGSISQGGSTITQQVVKNSLVGDERDLSRKLREALGARFRAGGVFSTGGYSYTLEDRLAVMPIDRLWQPVDLVSWPGGRLSPRRTGRR